MGFGSIPDWLTAAATQHATRGRPPLSGPTRAQSSNPAIRAQSTQAERQLYNPFDGVDVAPPAPAPPTPDSVFGPAGLADRPPPTPLVDLHAALGGLGDPLHPPAITENPQQALQLAALHGIQPPAQLANSYPNKDYGPAMTDAIAQVALQKLGGEENLKEPADLTNLALLLGGGVGGLALRGATAGAEAAAGGLEAGTAASSGGRAATALRGLGKVAKFPFEHPIATGASPVAAQAPLAALHGNPGELGKAFTGSGIEADILGAAGNAVTKAIPGVAGAAASDALSLPAQVLPSTFLTLRAGANAALGDPAELHQLQEEYRESSALPALLAGHLGEAASRAGEHPLYTALEAAAIKAGVGLGAGELARRLGVPGAQHEARPDLVAYGDVARHQGPYSRDLITRHFQRRADERRPIGPHGEKLLRPRETSAHLRGALDREVFAGEQVRRGNQRQVAHELEDVRPGGKGQADVVSHAIQGIARNPDRAIFDLQDYRDQLIAQQPNLTPSELTANRKQIATIEAALKDPRPDAVFNAAQTFIDQQRPITEALVERGLLDPDQARKAIAIPYARTHMDAGYGLSRADLAEETAIKEGLGKDRNIGELSRIRAKAQTLGPAGDPLTLDAIEAHMAENGVGDTGFVTQRPAPPQGPQSFFQPPNERGQLPSQRRTGEATTRGTFDPSWDAVIQQAIHGRTVLDKVNNFEHIVDRFGLRTPDGRSFADYAEAKRAADHPEDFNMRLPEIPGGWTPIRTAPWLAKKAELEAVKGLGHNNALEADQHAMVENFSADALKNALEAGDGPALLIPKVVAQRLRHHFQEVTPIEKGAQAITGAFKGAVLPTSPKWAAGNALDNFVVRSFGTGITPHDMLTGKRFAQTFKNELTPDEQARALESIVPGGLYGSYARIQPYRALDQFVGTRIEPLARAAHAVLTAPGVRTFAELYRRYRDTVFELDSKYVEQLPQYGQLAKSARQELDMSRHQFRKALKSMDPVISDFIRGFKNPEHVDRFAKEVETVFGNWGKNGPEARRFLSTWSPFWMWGRAAIKFAFITLPRDHPILTGLIASSEQMTREEREKLGFDFAGKEPLPDFLQGGIPASGGGVTALGGLTTFGTFNDLPQFLASVPAPQFSSAVLGGLGIDWKGDKLVDKDGRPASQLERVKAGVLGTLDAFVPFLNVGRSISSHGAGGLNPARTYPGSTVGYLRELHNTQEINVPIKEDGGGGDFSGNPFEGAEIGGSSEANPFDSLSVGP